MNKGRKKGEKERGDTLSRVGERLRGAGEERKWPSSRQSESADCRNRRQKEKEIHARV